MADLSTNITTMTEGVWNATKQVFGSDIATAKAKAPGVIATAAIILVTYKKLQEVRKAFDIQSNHINETKFGHETGQRYDRYQ